MTDEQKDDMPHIAPDRREKLARHFSTEEEWAMWEAYRRYYRAKYYGEKPEAEAIECSPDEGDKPGIQ